MEYGPFYPASVISTTYTAGGGGVPWSNPDNAKQPAGSKATASLGVEGVTEFLRATGFGANVPADANVTKVTFRVTPAPTGGGFNASAYEILTPAVDDEISQRGTDFVDEDSPPTPAQINGAEFGFQVAIYAEGGGVAEVDSVALFVETL